MDYESTAGETLAILRGLLHYHQRMMLGSACPAPESCEAGSACGRNCRRIIPDAYEAVLKEAIRCVELVNGRDGKSIVSAN